ncbi:MAG: radical SAM protein, partial [Henriciella sp.]
PFGRGNARSVPAGEVVTMVQRLVDTGHHEVVLTGVDMTSWGTDLPGQPPLGNLVQRILKLVPDLKQLRISSIDAIEIDDALIDALHEPRLAPYMHLSLQHGDNLILKRMKRRHRREEAIELCNKLRQARSDIALGADLIAGFPTETEAAFQNSIDLVEDCGLSFLHVFPFSPRPGTPAERMPQLDRALVKQRAAKLRAAGQSALQRHLDKHVGQISHVLVERAGRGRLPDFTEIQLSGSSTGSGGYLSEVQITGHNGTSLIGTLR